MKKYKLIKRYPGSKVVGTVVEAINSEAGLNTRYTDMIGGEYGWHEIEDFPEYWEEVEEPIFKAGDWIYCLDNGWNDTGHKKYSTVTTNGNIFRIKEFDKCSYDDQQVAVSDDSRVVYIGKRASKFRLATPKEIEAHLIEEAKKRGYTTGRILTNGTRWAIDAEGGYTYIPREDLLDAVNSRGDRDCTVYCNGIWSEMEEEQPIEIAGYIGNFGNKGIVSFGCKSYSKEVINQLISVMDIFEITSIHTQNAININTDLVRKIRDRIK